MDQYIQDNSQPEKIQNDIETFLGSRPPRISKRPESGYRKNIPILEKPAFAKFSKFIKFHRIPLQDFWRNNKANISIEEFRNLLYRIDFNPDTEFQEGIRQLEETNQLNVSQMGGVVPWWTQNRQDFQAFVNRITRMSQAQQKKSSKRKLMKSMNSFDKKFNLTQLSESQKNFTKVMQFDQTKIKLRAEERRQKQRLKAKQIEDSIENRISQIKYNLLVKTGQANQIALRLNEPTKFEVLKENQKLVVVKNNMKLSEADFRKQVNRLNQKLKIRQRVKYWQCADKEKALRKLKVTQNKNNQARDQQLKRVLVETVKLIIDFKRQIKLFQSKGINSGQNFPKSTTFV